MTSHLKKFIQEHIELIDDEDWYALFRATIDPEDFVLDSSEVIELTNILGELGFDTEKERRKVLDEYIESVAYVLGPRGSRYRLWLETYFLNYLGFTAHEIHHIINHNPNCSVKITPDNYGIDIAHRKQ